MSPPAQPLTGPASARNTARPKLLLLHHNPIWRPVGSQHETATAVLTARPAPPIPCSFLVRNPAGGPQAREKTPLRRAQRGLSGGQASGMVGEDGGAQVSQGVLDMPGVLPVALGGRLDAERLEQRGGGRAGVARGPENRMKSLVSEVMEDQVYDAPRVERLLITIVLVNHPSPPGGRSGAQLTARASACPGGPTRRAGIKRG